MSRTPDGTLPRNAPPRTATSKSVLNPARVSCRAVSSIDRSAPPPAKEGMNSAIRGPGGGT